MGRHEALTVKMDFVTRSSHWRIFLFLMIIIYVMYFIYLTTDFLRPSKEEGEKAFRDEFK